MRDGFIKVAAATPEIRVADVEYNTESILGLIRKAKGMGVKICVFPELCITGYTCGDLFNQSVLIDGAMDGLKRILRETGDVDMLCAVGLPVRAGGKLFNCAAVFASGVLLGLVPKTYLPNYGEFYEQRWFAAPESDMCYELEFYPDNWVAVGRHIFECTNMQGLSVGVEICEDLWSMDPPSSSLAQAGATVILNLSASDEVVGKAAYRRQLVSGQSARLVCGYIYADAGDGESTTDMVFQGHNIIAENGVILSEARSGAGIITSELDLGRLLHDRRRMNTYPPQSTDSDRLIISSFSLNLEETELTRLVARNPFVPSDLMERAERCGDILDIQCAGLKKRWACPGDLTPHWP